MLDDGARILLLDEELICVLIVQSELEARGYEVRATGDSKAAMALLRCWGPDLVILGCRPPDQTGYDLCERIREISSAPIITLAALDAEPKEVDDELKLGTGGYLWRLLETSE